MHILSQKNGNVRHVTLLCPKFSREFRITAGKEEGTEKAACKNGDFREKVTKEMTLSFQIQA